MEFVGDEEGSEEADRLARLAADLSLKDLGLDLDQTESQGSYGSQEEEQLPEIYDANETRRIYSEMIESCQELEDKQGFQANESKLLADQVKQSKVLFDSQFRGGEGSSQGSSNHTPRGQSQKGQRNEEDEESIFDKSQPPKTFNSNKDENGGGRESQIPMSLTQKAAIRADVTPWAMYLSYKHTAMCASIMRKNIQSMGCKDAIFSVDNYCASLKALGTNVLNVYSSKQALENVAKETSATVKTFPSLPCILGAFDHREFIKVLGKDKPENSSQAVKKRRTGRLFDKDTPASKHEEVNSQAPKTGENTDKIDQSTAEFRKKLVSYCQQEQSPANLFEFGLNKESIPTSLNNTFSLAFGIRDGSIALSHPGHNNKLLGVFSLQVQPCTAPRITADSDTTGSNTNRCQTIVSVSCKTLKQLQHIGAGENGVR